ncbi:SGNH/GDSL hydrolase family protein [Gordonia jinghuaiqii]|uniref:SGNH/GDSL hydrolase family protein n=1 Tax=Gordonia jinghuaiqii TaxID=2758710 RepID=UPI001CB7A8D2|nr:SGNH/GDSL hydrolase family protein [Gordonia jinghuaiqii]
MDARRSSGRRRSPMSTRGVVVAIAVVALAAAGCSSDGTSGEAATPPPAKVTSAQGPPGSSAVSEQNRVRLVNLGDSFASGTGTGPLVEDSPIYCQRSSKNFAHIVAAEEGYDLTDVSCAGADTADFRGSQQEGIPPQLDALDENVDVVTLMIGGNDKKTYGRAIELCGEVAATDLTGSPCTDKYGKSLIDPVEKDIYPAVRQALRDVKAEAPNAEILLAGYPWLLPPTTGCYPEMRIADGDVAMIRDLQTALNTYGRRAAQETGARFVDMSQVSEGHDACAGDQRWIEPMTTPGPGAVHPNERGQEAIAEQVRKALAMTPN